jgi:hypothetical protein
MPSSSGRAFLPIAALILVATWPQRASAQQQVQGFALDRLYQSAPGGGWFVMDTLDMHGGLGGVMCLSTEEAHNPLRVRSKNGSQSFAVVSNEAIVDFGFAATFERLRLYLNLDMPLDVTGNGGTVGAYEFTAPNASQKYTPSGVNPSTAPDAFADARVGLDVRVFGSYDGPLRIGASAQLFVPSPNTSQSEYLTDGTFRAMGRVLFAGDIGMYSYAAQIGVHVRPYDATPTPGSPEGSELLFGAAVGRRFGLGEKRAMALVVGPEVYGETAFRSFFGAATTGVEGLFTGRVEGTADDGAQIRVKLGAGGGLAAQFGTPEWRVVFGIEVFDHSNHRDGDGVSDSKDACPDRAGIKTHDPKTNGCPAVPGTDGTANPLDSPIQPRVVERPDAAVERGSGGGSSTSAEAANPSL